MSAWLYILHCADNSYYVGTTRGEFELRMSQHEQGFHPTCYTFKRRPVRLVFAENFLNITDAIAAERQVKGWRRDKKEALIRKEYELLPMLAERYKKKHL